MVFRTPYFETSGRQRGDASESNKGISPFPCTKCNNVSSVPIQFKDCVLCWWVALLLFIIVVVVVRKYIFFLFIIIMLYFVLL